MKPARFKYLRPDNLANVLDVLAQYGSNAAILAGGQSLIPMLNLRLASPAVVIDINRVGGLDRIEVVDGRLEIGARARHNEVLRSAIIHERAPLLSMALSHVAHEAVRNRGTIGGSLALADPSAELPACAVCLGAEMIAASAHGVRRIPAEIFFESLYTTKLAPDELLIAVSVPQFDPTWHFGFDEIARRHGDFAIAGLALATRVEDGRLAECRVVYTGIESAPKRAAEAERCLVGSGHRDSGVLAKAQAALSRDLEPMEGGAFPPGYRLHLARVLLSRVLDCVAKDIEANVHAPALFPG